MSNTTITILIASSSSLVAITFISICLIRCCRYYFKNKQIQEQQNIYNSLDKINLYKNNIMDSIPISQSIPIKATAPPLEEDISFNDQIITFNQPIIPHKIGFGGNGYYAPNYLTNYSI